MTLTSFLEIVKTELTGGALLDYLVLVPAVIILNRFVAKTIGFVAGFFVAIFILITHLSSSQAAVLQKIPDMYQANGYAFFYPEIIVISVAIFLAWISNDSKDDFSQLISIAGIPLAMLFEMIRISDAFKKDGIYHQISPWMELYVVLFVFLVSGMFSNWLSDRKDLENMSGEELLDEAVKRIKKEERAQADFEAWQQRDNEKRYLNADHKDLTY